MGQQNANLQAKQHSKRGLANREAHRRLNPAQLSQSKTPQQPVHPQNDLKTGKVITKSMIYLYDH